MTTTPTQADEASKAALKIWEASNNIAVSQGEATKIIRDEFTPVTVKAALADELAAMCQRLRDALVVYEQGNPEPTMRHRMMMLDAKDVLTRHAALTASPLPPETEAENRQALAAEIESE